MGVSRKWSALAGLVVAATISGGALATQASAATTHTVSTTCAEAVYGEPFSYDRLVTVGATAPGSVASDGSVVVTGLAENLVLPNSSTYPELVSGYQNIETDFQVVGGTVSATAQTAPAAMNGMNVPSVVEPGDGNGIVRWTVEGPIPPGTLRTPAFTVTVTPDAGATEVTMTATQYFETTLFDGPGPPTSGAATCAVNTLLTTTAVGGSGTTSTTKKSTTTTTTTGPTDPPVDPVASISDTSVQEPVKNISNMAFVVTLATASPKGVVIHYTTVDGTALHRYDFGAKHGTVRFAKGKTYALIQVRVKADKVSDPNDEFTVVLSDSKNTLIGRATGTGTILGG